jgi:hypothetical protein
MTIDQTTADPSPGMASGHVGLSGCTPTPSKVWTSPSAPRGRQHRSRVTYREPRVCGERGSAHWREFAEALVAMLQFHLPPRSHFLASDVHPMCTPSA